MARNVKFTSNKAAVLKEITEAAETQIRQALEKIVEEVRASHHDRSVKEIHAELDRRMSEAGITNGNWGKHAKAIAQGKPTPINIDTVTKSLDLAAAAPPFCGAAPVGAGAPAGVPPSPTRPAEATMNRHRRFTAHGGARRVCHRKCT